MHLPPLVLILYPGFLGFPGCHPFPALGASMVPIAGYQFALNSPSSVRAKVNFIALQAGIA
jgi:hypothetical protein